MKPRNERNATNNEYFEAESFARALARWGRVGGYERPEAWVMSVTTAWIGTAASEDVVADLHRVVATFLPPGSAVPSSGPTVPGGRHIVALPSRPQSESNMAARFTGTLERHGDCLDLVTRTGDRHLVVWAGEAEMLVDDTRLIDVR